MVNNPNEESYLEGCDNDDGVPIRPEFIGLGKGGRDRPEVTDTSSLVAATEVMCGIEAELAADSSGGVGNNRRLTNISIGVFKDIDNIEVGEDANGDGVYIVRERSNDRGLVVDSEEKVVTSGGEPKNNDGNESSGVAVVKVDVEIVCNRGDGPSLLMSSSQYIRMKSFEIDDMVDRGRK